MVFRRIYEASRNLGSQLPPRFDHVEACRPLEAAFILLGPRSP